MGEKLNFFTSFIFLSKYMKKYKKNFFMFYTGWLLDTLMSISLPILLGIMINEIVYYQNLNSFLKISGVFVVMSAFSSILYYLIYAQHQYLMSTYMRDIQTDIFDHLQKCDAEHMSDMGSGEAVQILQGYTIECIFFVIRNIIHFSNNILSIIIISIYIFIISWQIGLFIFLAAPLTVLINVKLGGKIRGYADKQREYYGQYISWVFEMLSGIRDLRMLGAVGKVNKNFVKSHKKMFEVSVKSGVSTLTANNILKLVNLIVQLSIFTFVGYLAIDGRIEIGFLIIIVTFYAVLVERINIVSGYNLDAQSRISYIQRIYDFLNTPTEDDWKGTNELEITNGEISFRNIDFKYKNSKNVLNDFSFHIDSGERIGLVGKSGSGKTTLAYMLIGFYKPQLGYIEIDGQKISDCSLKSIRKNIGIIQQDVLIFEGSIKDNLLLGKRNASDEEIRSACERAGILNFIDSLPNGISTLVGKNGVGLSGGQKQRIAIARIYLKDPKIIIFDEATSSLDSETEEQIHEAWENVLSGRTSIIIAHRQSSIMLCKKVAIIDDGRLCEVGKPNEMIKNSKIFRSIFAIGGEA